VRGNTVNNLTIFEGFLNKIASDKGTGDVELLTIKANNATQRVSDLNNSAT